MLVLSGKLECKLFFPDNPDNLQTVLLEAGQQIYIKPGLAHIVTARDRDALAIETSPTMLSLDDQVAL
jgi:oxalate decarboxylase/phosphoglucose isomerase-like protein (cupin superfamily)